LEQITQYKRGQNRHTNGEWINGKMINITDNQGNGNQTTMGYHPYLLVSLLPKRQKISVEESM
jgi:hypothetical protein